MSGTKEKPKDNREDVVLIASTLYSIVAGLAITTAIEGLLKGINGAMIASPLDLARDMKHAALVVSFFLFALPFYHGATLVLVRRMRSSEQGALSKSVVDFTALFLEAGILYALSLASNSLNIFLSWLFTLLAVDIIWAGYGLKTDSATGPVKTALRWWVALNSVAILYVGVFRFIIPLYYPLDENIGSYLLFAIAFLRTSIDYWKCKGFYFPKK